MKIKELCSSHKLLEQFMKFAVVGVLAFIIDYGLMIFLTEVFSIGYLLSATISFIVSVIFNYVCSMHYVFSHRENMTKKFEFFIFVILSAIGLGLNDLLMYIGTDLLAIDYRITKIIATFIVTWFNFFTRRYFLDEHKKRKDNAFERFLDNHSENKYLCKPEAESPLAEAQTPAADFVSLQASAQK